MCCSLISDTSCGPACITLLTHPGRLQLNFHLQAETLVTTRTAAR